ncbi:hypothetical protein [Lactobacillus delbrueckii]|nr:hypothetical protein [Lactobacillus delbrueckii]MDF4029960.1 hypothetical protein [Lactobacillus delbrueckii]
MTNETELLQAVQQLADKSVAPFDLQITARPSCQTAFSRRSLTWAF